MELRLQSAKFDLLFDAINRIYVKSRLEIDNYRVRGKYVYFVPNEELTPRHVLLLAKQEVEIKDYAVFLKVQNTNLTNTLNANLSFAEFNGPGTTWGDMDAVQSGTTHTILKKEPYTNGVSMLDLDILVNLADVEDVFNNRSLNAELSNLEYPIPNGTLTYEFINEYWQSVYFDFVDAFYVMRGKFQAESGATEADKLASLPITDQQIVAAWDLIEPELKEPVRLNAQIPLNDTKLFELYMKAALEVRYNDWRQWYKTYMIENKFKNVFYPSLIASVLDPVPVGSQLYAWEYRDKYLDNYLRYPYFGNTFGLITFNNDITANVNYNDASFIYIPGTFTDRANVVSLAEKILISRKYYRV